MQPIDGGYRIPQDVPITAPPELGTDAPFFQILPLALDAARSDEEVTYAGNFIWAYDASDLDTVISVKFNNQLSTALPFYKGQVVKGQPFSRLFITNAAQAGKTINLLVVRQTGDFSIENPGATFSSVGVTKATTGASPVHQTITAGAAAASIMAASATRRTAIVRCPTTNTQNVLIGVGAASDATHGIELEPGDSITIDGTMVLYAYTAAGANQTVQTSYTGD